MATIVRGTKSTSNANSTAFANSTDPTAAEINTDFNTLYTEINGALDSDNFATSAVDLAGPKLTGILGTAGGGTGTAVGVRLLLTALASVAEGDTRYSMLHNSEDTEEYVQWPAPFAMTIKTLRINNQAAQSATGSTIVRLRVNGVDTGVSATIPESGPINYYTGTGSVDVIAGDLLAFSTTNMSTVASTTIFISAEGVPA